MGVFVYVNTDYNGVSLRAAGLCELFDVEEKSFSRVNIGGKESTVLCPSGRGGVLVCWFARSMRGNECGVTVALSCCLA